MSEFWGALYYLVDTNFREIYFYDTTFNVKRIEIHHKYKDEKQLIVEKFE